MYEDIRNGMPTIEFYSRKYLRYRIHYRRTSTDPLVSLPYRMVTLKGYTLDIYTQLFYDVRDVINSHIGSDVVVVSQSLNYSAVHPLLPHMTPSTIYDATFVGVYAIYLEVEYPKVSIPYNYSNWSELFLGYEVAPELALNNSIPQTLFLSPSEKKSTGFSFRTAGGAAGRWSPQKLSYDVKFNSRSNGRKGDVGIGTYSSQSSLVTSTVNEFTLELFQVPARFIMRNQAVGAFGFSGSNSQWLDINQNPSTFYAQNLSDVLPWLMSANKDKPIKINFDNMIIMVEPNSVKEIGQRHKVVIANGVDSLSDVIESVNNNRFYNVSIPFIMTENGTGNLGLGSGWHKTYAPAEAGRVFKNV